MSQDYNEDLKNNQQDSSQESEYAYKNVMGEKPKKRTWSVVSFVLSLVSLIVCSITPIVGIILGLFSIGCAIFSRKNMNSVHLLHRGELSPRQINTQTNRAVLPRPSYPRRSRQ